MTEREVLRSETTNRLESQGRRQQSEEILAGRHGPDSWVPQCTKEGPEFRMPNRRAPEVKNDRRGGS